MSEDEVMKLVQDFLERPDPRDFDKLVHTADVIIQATRIDDQWARVETYIWVGFANKYIGFGPPRSGNAGAMINEAIWALYPGIPLECISIIA